MWTELHSKIETHQCSTLHQRCSNKPETLLDLLGLSVWWCVKVESGPICAVMRCQCCDMIEEQHRCDLNYRSKDAWRHIIKTDNMSLCTSPKKLLGEVRIGGSWFQRMTLSNSANELSQRCQSPANNSCRYAKQKLQTLKLKSQTAKLAEECKHRLVRNTNNSRQINNSEIQNQPAQSHRASI